MNRSGKGTGSIRQQRWDRMTAWWPECEHRCPEHGVWAHRALPEVPCHMPAWMECPRCLEWPLNSEVKR